MSKPSISEMEEIHDLIHMYFIRIAKDVENVKREAEKLDIRTNGNRIKVAVDSLRGIMFEIQEAIELEKRNARKNSMVGESR